MIDRPNFGPLPNKLSHLNVSILGGCVRDGRLRFKEAGCIDCKASRDHQREGNATAYLHSCLLAGIRFPGADYKY